MTLVSQAVCELHLGRVEEAQSALEQALQKQPDYADAIANLLVLTVITGKDATELTRYADTVYYQPLSTYEIATSSCILTTHHV